MDVWEKLEKWLELNWSYKAWFPPYRLRISVIPGERVPGGKGKIRIEGKIAEIKIAQIDGEDSVREPGSEFDSDILPEDLVEALLKGKYEGDEVGRYDEVRLVYRNGKEGAEVYVAGEFEIPNFLDERRLSNGSGELEDWLVEYHGIPPSYLDRLIDYMKKGYVLEIYREDEERIRIKVLKANGEAIWEEKINVEDYAKEFSEWSESKAWC